ELTGETGSRRRYVETEVVGELSGLVRPKLEDVAIGGFAFVYPVRGEPLPVFIHIDVELFHDGITRRVYYREERYHSDPQKLDLRPSESVNLVNGLQTCATRCCIAQQNPRARQRR